MSIGIVAVLTVQDGKADEFKAVMAELGEAVRANEAGCQQYDLFTAADNPHVFYVLEQYADQAAFDAHMKSPHFAAAQPKLGGLLAAAPDLKILSKA